MPYGKNGTRQKREIMYSVIMGIEPEFRAERLNRLMTQRDLTTGQLQYLTGVSQSMLSRLQRGDRSNVSAVIVAKLAHALSCSVEYLVGLTDNPAPLAMKLDDELIRLIRIARELRPYRLQDLIEIAEMYREKKEDSALLMDAILSAVESEGGIDQRDRLLSVLESLSPFADDGAAGDDAGILPGDDGEQPSGSNT